MRLENWIVVPNYGGEVAIGEVYDNPKFPDGASVMTSTIREKHLDEKYVLTKNSRYELGTPLKRNGD